MNQIDRPLVIGLGEILWDCFDAGRRPGGAPANQAFHANQLGALGIVASRVGRDALGDELVTYLEDRGLATHLIQRDGDRPTGTVTVAVNPDGEPTYEIHAPVAWDHIQSTDALDDVLDQADAVCFGTLAQRCDESRETIQRALERASNAIRLFDVNLRQSFYSAETLRESLRRADVVKLNEQEAAELPGLLGTGTNDPAGLARWLRDELDISLLCVTLSARGCLLFEADEAIEIPGVPTQVRNAVGAGDAFTAALLMGRLSGWPLDRMGRFANGVGSLVAASDGAMPVLGSRIDELRSRT